MVWFVGQVKSQSEVIAQNNLKELGFDSYYPLIKEIRPKGPRIVPMFPGYLFIRTDSFTAQRWQVIKSTRGIYGVITNSSERPSTLPNGWVEDLMKQGEVIMTIDKMLSFKIGDKLMVQNGLLAGKDGVCVSTKEERVGVLLSLLGRDTVVYLNKDTLDLTDEVKGNA